MPAGDLLDDDFQIEVNGLLHDGSATSGAATYELMSWPKLLDKPVKGPILEGLGDGDFPGRVYAKALDLAWDVDITNATPATLQANLLTLLATWNGTETELHFRVAGVHYMREGQTRRYEVNDTRRAWGWVTVTLEFHAQPTLTVVP